MARHISVYRPEDIEYRPDGGWQVRDGAESVYDDPLGSEVAVCERWSEPAVDLGLPLLAAISDYGFYHGIRWSGNDLPGVLDELHRLEAHWGMLGLDPGTAADLAERAGYLRAAITAATACDGSVTIV